MDWDEEDNVFYGTPIEREEEITSRKKKAVAEASGQLRSLVPWKQEVTDEEGRRRFHGAFTGGFSAGYYNTVGSKEGWTPQSFTSSRKDRAEVQQQSILNFLDEDEKADFEGRSLGTSSQFDTFGFTAMEVARNQAEKAQQQRASAIPGPVPDELIVPPAESIGVKLLLKMGWRHGRSIKGSQANSLYDARREARRALLAFSSGDVKAHPTDPEPLPANTDTAVVQPATDDVHSSQSTPGYVINPKQDFYGLGFDPYKNAPEFREKKRAHIAGNQDSGHRKAFPTKENHFGFKSGKIAPGFGIGALEELDAEDEDVYASAYDFEEKYVQEIDEPSRSILDGKQKFADGKQKLIGNKQDVLLGFRVASNSDYQLDRFSAPVVPKDFVPHHTFSGTLETDYKLSDTPPKVVPPPDDINLKILIDGVSTLVTRCGKLFEDLSREKNQTNPLFSFLNGGNGHEYYTRKLWEESRKSMDQTKHGFDGKLSPRMEKMTAETRGKILRERPLEKSSKGSSSSVTSDVQLQFNLSDTFTRPASFSELPEAVKPFKDDPAKQERFECFLKEKYQGGLRSTDSGGASYMSEAARARERLDFEAAAEIIEKGKHGKLSYQHLVDFSAPEGMQFTPGGVENAKEAKVEDMIAEKTYPNREEYQWRPSPVLCKRFDLSDPYMGKPPPPPRVRSKIDTLIFTADSVKINKPEASSNKDSVTMPQSDTRGMGNDAVGKDNEEVIEVENVERPVDLYKAIFSDDSDDEEDAFLLNKMEDPEKNMEVANTTLNRLIAGDFLESLGKELGLEVPPSLDKVQIRDPEKEAADIRPVEESFSAPDFGLGSSTKTVRDGRYEENELIHGNSARSGSKYVDGDLSKNKLGKVLVDNVYPEDREIKRHSRSRHDRSGNSSSENERSKKGSRQHRYSSDSEHGSFNEDRDEYHSRSNRRKKRTSREKSGSGKESKHHKHRRRDHGKRER